MSETIHPAPKVVVFDWGGIFTEGTFDADAVRNLANQAGATQEEIGKTYFPLMEEFEAGAFDIEEFTTRFLRESGLSLSREQFQETFLSSGIDRPQMFELLATIPAQTPVAILSNNVPVLCDRVRHDPRMKRVDRFLFSNEIGVRKPDVGAFERLRKELDLDYDGMIFIDDNRANIDAANALGITGIHYQEWDSFHAEFRALVPAPGQEA